MGTMVEQRRELGLRKAAVLNAVVEEYVRSGEPVGSETIADSSGLGVSSATIRNEMAALEELGFLTHPHTSAGRIPTDTGYRHYVDTQPHGARLRDAHRRAIAGYFAAFSGLNDPDAQWVVVLSVIPFFSPYLMPARMLLTSPSAGEILLALVLLAATLALALWIASRIYSAGVLLYGQRVGLRSVWRATRVAR